jgi:hypothetical protein
MPVRRPLALALLALVPWIALAVAQPAVPVLEAEAILLEPLRPSEVGATSAVVRVATAIDVACVVVYGRTDAFGQMALDQDMGGSAHSDHFVVMRNLEPDTDYVFRIQGSDLAGNFYASRTVRFRTLPAAEGADLGENLARNTLGARVVGVSSNFGGGDNASRWGADSALDADGSTEWSSDGDGDDAFLSVELPQTARISGFGLWTRTMGSSAQIESFTVENELGELFGPFELPDASGMHSFPVDASGRTFTFRVTASSGGNTGAVEVGIFSQQE